MPRILAINALRFGAVGFHMHCVVNEWSEDDPIVRQVLDDQFDEDESLAIWYYLARQAQNGSLMIDVGAYAGLYSLVAAIANAEIRVAAFEAAAVTYGRLVANIMLNGMEGRICGAHLAAWDREAAVRLPHRYGIYSMCPGESATFDQPVDHIEHLFGIPLDSVLKGAPDTRGSFASKSLGVTSAERVAAVKIDVGGAEERVIDGAREIMARDRCFILCEILSASRLEALTAKAAALDYRVDRVGEERNYLLSPTERYDNFLLGYQAWIAALPGRLHLTGSRVHQIEAFPTTG
ncbi:MAG: FkbM family methyltransferase [Sphingobium sp.]